MRNIDKSTICTEKNHLEMGGESRSLTAKPCGSCKTATATVFCLTDSTFLCRSCDGKVHAVNKLASRHARVSVCEVCEQAPAVVTCKADAAAFCPTCDRDIHSTNSLARRHERLPIVPFYDAASPTKSTHSASSGDEFSEEEAQAASWLLPDPNSKLDEESETPEYRSTDYLLGDMDPYHLDLDLVSGEQKAGPTIVNEQKPYSSDGVVPVQDKNEYGSGRYHGGIVDGSPAYDVDYPASKPYTYNFTSRISQNAISSSSLEVGVVPEHNATADLSKNDVVPSRVSGVDREARVLRYKEKRKNRRFEKTVRYASRKAHAETRPRIKGRFAKRTELDADSLIVVPTF